MLPWRAQHLGALIMSNVNGCANPLGYDILMPASPLRRSCATLFQRQAIRRYPGKRDYFVPYRSGRGGQQALALHKYCQHAQLTKNHQHPYH